jgi:hypothetical protein
MDWEKPGKILTGNHGCSHEIWELAVVVVFLKPIHRNVEKNHGSFEDFQGFNGYQLSSQSR